MLSSTEKAIEAILEQAKKLTYEELLDAFSDIATFAMDPTAEVVFKDMTSKKHASILVIVMVNNLFTNLRFREQAVAEKEKQQADPLNINKTMEQMSKDYEDRDKKRF